MFDFTYASLSQKASQNAALCAHALRESDMMNAPAAGRTPSATAPATRRVESDTVLPLGERGGNHVTGSASRRKLLTACQVIY